MLQHAIVIVLPLQDALDQADHERAARQREATRIEELTAEIEQLKQDHTGLVQSAEGHQNLNQKLQKD